MSLVELGVQVNLSPLDHGDRHDEITPSNNNLLRFNNDFLTNLLSYATLEIFVGKKGSFFHNRYGD